MGKTPDKGASMRSNADRPRKRASQTPLSARVTKLEQLVKAGMSERFAAKIVGLSEDEVRDALRIPSSDELTNEVFVTALTKRVAKNRSGAETANERASKLERRADDTETRVAAIEEFLGRDNAAAALEGGKDGGRKSFIQALRDRRVSDDDIRRTLVIVDDGELELSDADMFGELYTAYVSLRACVEEHETRLTHVEQVVEDIDTSTYVPLLGWLMALAVGIVVWFIFWLNPYGATGPLMDGNGKIIGSSSMGWHAGKLGLGMGIMAFGIVLLIARSSRRRHTRSSSTSSRSSRSGSTSTSFRQRIVNFRVRPRNRNTTTSNEDDDTRVHDPEPSPASS